MEKEATGLGNIDLANQERAKQLELLRQQYELDMKIADLETRHNKQVLDGLDELANARKEMLDAFAMDKVQWHSMKQKDQLLEIK
jgi:hypothetical protein